ncbi:DUF402 domain-containing protein [Nocardioides dubius]|uniref:DUF402 domain-containing protein n=1 Tax=Nocardioides dubius TaxID=317019 RepID=UPI0031E3CECE
MGQRVEIAMTKWRTLPHWSYAGIYLGSDAHGDWIGLPSGTVYQRPGVEYEATNDAVTLVPSANLPERGWMAAFYGRGRPWSKPAVATPVEIYVDITTPPRWDGVVLRAVDLDLDVIRGTTGRTWVDDEDEFAEHRRTLDYPDVVIAHATLNCEQVHDAVRNRIAPFDGATAERWLRTLSALRG